MKTIGIRFVSILFFALMLLFPAESLSGAGAGLLLWFQTVLPTLLPAMILSDYLIRIGADRSLGRLAARPLLFLFGVSQNGSYAVLVGFLCGYPMGAKTSASLLTEGRIGRGEAAYLLSFCNQPSPMFLVGFLCLSLLAPSNRGSAPVVPVLAGVYGSAVFISLLYRALRRMDRRFYTAWSLDKARTPQKRPHEIAQDGRPPLASTGRTPADAAPPAQKTTASSPLALLETSMMTSFEVMVKIGGYMMLFSVLESLVWKLPIPFPLLQSACMGFIEMTTGSRQIAASAAHPWAAALCAGAVAFGGLSGLAQTANVLQGSGLPVRQYFGWKLLQGVLAAVAVLLWYFLCGVYPPLG